MSTPTSRSVALAGALLLAACQQTSRDADAGNNALPTQSAVHEVKDWIAGREDDRRETIACRYGADAALARDCRIEMVDDAQGRTLILSRPDGRFRRVRLGADGTLAAADGAVEARITSTAGAINVSFGDELYAVPLSAVQ